MAYREPSPPLLLTSPQRYLLPAKRPQGGKNGPRQTSDGIDSGGAKAEPSIQKPKEGTAQQVSSLCGIEACMIPSSPDNSKQHDWLETQTFPEDAYELKRIVKD